MHVSQEISELLEGLNNPSLPGIDLSLARMVRLLAALGNPEKKLSPVIHFAGTNGKGSTLAFLRAIYEAQGYRVHAYTSPHLVRFNERIVIAGSEISDDYLLQLLQQVRDAARDIPVTFFEATTAMAFLAFSQHGADVVLIETGLGGRLDATNVMAKPLATVITPVDVDHTEFLGETLAEIAAEKAGIMKRGVPCFVGQQKPEALEVLKRIARARDAQAWLFSREWSYAVTPEGFALHSGARAWALPKPALAGAHQYQNAALAAAVATALPALPVSDEALTKGIVAAVWPARLQRLTAGPLVAAWGARGDVYLDGGHNPSAALTLRAWVQAQKSPVTLLVGMMARKDAAGFLAPLVDVLARVIVVTIAGHDSYDKAMLADIARTQGAKAVFLAANQDEIIEQMQDCGNGALVIAGSLFLAGEILKNHS